jgi:HEAT repeat protein
MFFGRPPDIEALKRVRDIPGLIKALSNRNTSISAGAAESLGETGDASVIEPLVEAYRRDNGPHRAVIKALGAFPGDQRTLIPLVSGVLDHGPEVREEATKCLSRYGDMEAVAGEVARRIGVAQDALVTYLHIGGQAGWDMLKVLPYVREEASRRLLGADLLSRLVGAEAAQKTISACEDRGRLVYDKSTDLLVTYILEMPHDSRLAPGILAAAEDKKELEDVRRYAALFREKLLKKGVDLSRC